MLTRGAALGISAGLRASDPPPFSWVTRSTTVVALGGRTGVAADGEVEQGTVLRKTLLAGPRRRHAEQVARDLSGREAPDHGTCT